jgi:hypothetical protein
MWCALLTTHYASPLSSCCCRRGGHVLSVFFASSTLAHAHTKSVCLQIATRGLCLGSGLDIHTPLCFLNTFHRPCATNTSSHAIAPAYTSNKLHAFVYAACTNELLPVLVSQLNKHTQWVCALKNCPLHTVGGIFRPHVCWAGNRP